MNKLIGMVEFVLQDQHTLLSDRQYADRVIAYANFLKRPLELGIFIPTDLDGNVLEEPNTAPLESPLDYPSKLETEYFESQERILFEGLTVEKRKDYYVVFSRASEVWVSWNESKTIESLIRYDLTLTDPRQKNNRVMKPATNTLTNQNEIIKDENNK